MDYDQPIRIIDDPAGDLIEDQRDGVLQQLPAGLPRDGRNMKIVYGVRGQKDVYRTHALRDGGGQQYPLHLPVKACDE